MSSRKTGIVLFFHQDIEITEAFMKRLLSCEYNMDSGCVELKFNDSSMIAINCTVVENEVADNMYRRLEH